MDLEKIINRKGYKKICAETGLPVETADALIDSYLKGMSSVINPVILHMLGIPGSGKTMYVREHSVPNAIVITFDGIMDKLQEYQDNKVFQEGKSSFLKWELCASEIGYELLFRCINNRFNIVFDHSGSRLDHVELLIHLKRKEGYQIKIVNLLIDETLAVERAAARDRYLPPEYIPERKKFWMVCCLYIKLLLMNILCTKRHQLRISC